MSADNRVCPSAWRAQAGEGGAQKPAAAKVQRRLTAYCHRRHVYHRVSVSARDGARPSSLVPPRTLVTVIY